VRKTQPDKHALYQLTHKRGQIVMQVKEINDTRWRSLVWPPLLWVRAKDSVFQQLTAEENLMREVELTGLLRNSRTLDIFVVTIGG
jgi:ABC-type branched-subunit amino acid transport system ATPase component